MQHFEELFPGLFYLSNDNPKSRYNYLIMDLDYTIIKPKSGGVFPQDENDWEFLNPDALNFISKYHALIIITNQAGYKNKPWILNLIYLVYHKINSSIVDISIEIYVATGKDRYRKPNTGIMEYIYDNKFGSYTVLTYVGDAMGRPTDFADTDLKFFENMKIFFRIKKKDNKHVSTKMQSPEEFYTKNNSDISPKDYKQKLTGFNPKLYLKTYYKKQELNVKLPEQACVIVMIGAPASGKSTLSAKLKKEYKHLHILSQDVLGKIKLMRDFEKLNEDTNSSMIIDRTNATPALRKPFLLNHKYRIALVLDTPEELYNHLNTVRMRLGQDMIPEIAYRTYRKQFVEPTTAEGFDLIVHVPFIPQFTNKNALTYFLQWS